MEKVADVLARKYPQFNTATPDCLVSDALYQMCCENVEYLIVLEDERFLGVITHHDIASKVLFDHRPLNKIIVKEFMNTTLPVATSENSLEYCMQLIERYNARHIAIFDDFDFKGVVSSHDLMQQALTRNENLESSWEVRQGYPWS
ncbi:MAG TPA: CBS domain-containing protein [Flavisolibacter sp.]|nr:CBS domain-containing protein [Flavisolibacter sp.]